MAVSKNIKESDAPINILPEYRIRTMKDDLAEELPIISETPKVPEPEKEELISKKLSEPLKPSEVPSKARGEGRKSKKGLVYAFIAIIILAGIGGFFYWMGAKPESEPEPTTPEQLQPSESLIQVDETKILSLSNEIALVELIKQEAEKSQTVETFKRIAILKNEVEFLSLNELLKELNIKIPPYALAELKDNYTLIVYSQDGKRRLGLVIETKNADNLKEQLRFWEQTMVNDLKNFYLTETPGEPATSEFQDNIYPPISPTGKQANIRYINFPEPGLTIDYTIVENLFILMTSKKSMYKAIDRIVENL